MTQDDIIRMAREANDWGEDMGGLQFVTPKILKRFAQLIAAYEREACAKVCDAEWGKGYSDDGSDAWMGHNNAVRTCAATIRARSGHD